MGTLKDLTTDYPATSRQKQEEVLDAAKQLQGLKQVVVAGAGANTNIAIAGIAVADKLVGVVEHPDNGAVVDRTSTTTITTAGNIQCSVSTTGNKLVVTYFDVA